MSHTPHELAADFPEHTDTIHRLKMTDGAFRVLAERYHEVNRAIHRAGRADGPTSRGHDAQRADASEGPHCGHAGLCLIAHPWDCHRTPAHLTSLRRAGRWQSCFFH